MCRQWVCYATVLLVAKHPRSRLSLSLPLCSGTLWMWWHRWQQLAELVPSVNGVQQLYPAAMNIRAERGMERPAPDINKGITKIAVQPLLPVSLGTRLCSSLPESKYSGTCMLNYLWTQSVTTLYETKMLFQLAHQFKNIVWLILIYPPVGNGSDMLR